MLQTSSSSVLFIINSGSSSLKFLVTGMGASQKNQSKPLGQNLYRGRIDSIGGSNRLQVSNGNERVVHSKQVDVANHGQAIQIILDWLSKEAPSLDIVAVGHRVVHGGTRYHQPVLITPQVLDYLHSLIPLAPNHQPACLLGITELARLQPELIQIACFDTAFHHDRPEVEQHFALPSWPELELVRRYGFHGLSYEYITKVLPDLPGKIAERKVIVAHLGHGASLCAMKEGHSVATTMTFTPLDGIPMGTRCGAIDPAVVIYLQQQGMPLQAVSDLLYFQSGLLGVSGESDNMADLLELKTPQAQRAIEQFVHHSVRAIGSLAATLEGLDALVFTGGIGEHSAVIREAICKRCVWLGLYLDAAANKRGFEYSGLERGTYVQISTKDSPVGTWVISTDEEHMIAEHSIRLLNNSREESST